MAQPRVLAGRGTERALRSAGQARQLREHCRGSVVRRCAWLLGMVAALCACGQRDAFNHAADVTPHQRELERAFAICAGCHDTRADLGHRFGPNLHGVSGEPIGAAKGGFAFSDALKSHGGTWDWKNLNDWIHNPKKFAPGTKMTFAGLSSAEDRANLLVYMNAQGGKLTIPAAVAAPEADASAAASDAPAAEASGAASAAPAAAASAAPAAH